MFNTLPADPEQILEWDWADFTPYFSDLRTRPLDADSIQQWLADWSALSNVLEEYQNRLSVAISVDTTDAQAEQRYNNFFDHLYPRVMEAAQVLKQRLLNSGLEPAGFEIPLRNLRAEASLYRDANLPLLAEENKHKTDYDKIISAQMVIWEGQERTITQMHPVYQDNDRARREAAWRLVAERQLADREAINRVWADLLKIRIRQAENAGLPDYRAYRWQSLLRFDYTPADALRFHDAIEEVVVPAAQRVYGNRREKLGLTRLRPWDLEVDLHGLPPLRPFKDIEEFIARGSRIFHRVDPVLGQYFDCLVSEDLLDLENRKNKAPGGYCTVFPVIQRPFLFMNAVSMHDSVQTLLHEGGHAFHVFETTRLLYHQNCVPMEFAEVASMAMELLAAPYLPVDQGGFYTPAEAARARSEHLEACLCFWPYMAVVDAFQHWVYENPAAAADPAECDACWSGLWQRFMKGVDWSGLEAEMATGWQRKLHIYTDPFYYIEYGMAQLGAVQVWANALADQAGAVAAYRRALALGGTVGLPELYQAAGARFAFDAATLRQAVDLLERTIGDLRQA